MAVNKKIKYYINLLMFLLLLIGTFFITSCKENDVINVEGAKAELRFVTSDIKLFWDVIDQITPNFTQEKFKNLYIEKGTIGLKDYDKQINLSQRLANILMQPAYNNYYKAIKNNTLDYSEENQISKKSFEKFKLEYSKTRSHNVYFLIGGCSAAGRVSNNGLLIAVEMLSKSDTMTLKSLDLWHQNVIKSKKYIPSIVIHEIIHSYQTNFKPKNNNFVTLLEQSIREGMADFLAKYFINNHPFFNEYLHNFGEIKEREVWNKFKLELEKNYSATEWLYTGKQTTYGYPADMGYYVGYKIIETYFNKFSDKKNAIKNLLEASDYYKLYNDSGYNEKFN